MDDLVLSIKVTCSRCDAVVFDRLIDAHDREAILLVVKSSAAADEHARECAAPVFISNQDLLHAA